MISMAHDIYLCPEHSGVILSHGPLVPPKESKMNGVMVDLGKNRLKLA